MAHSARILSIGVALAAGFAAGAYVANSKVGADPKSAVVDDRLSADERDALYAKLGHDVADFERQQDVLKTVIRLTGPAVVHIVAKKSETEGRRSRSQLIEESGSGVIFQINENYYVLTNRHVIRDANVREIELGLSDGRKLSPTKKWDDPTTDVAVLAISGTGLTAARLGDSSLVEVGDYAVAVGSPFGLTNSVSYGIISATGRRDLLLGDELKYKDFLQTDAAINPGNSGGPLINLRGEIIGINTAIASNSGSNDGVGFSIPINMAVRVARQLVERGAVVRAFLGVTLDRLFDANAALQLGIPRLQGAKIEKVTRGAPAETAKLQVGDVILQFNGKKVDDDTHLVNLVTMTDVGTEVPVIVMRDKKQVEVRVTVGNATDFVIDEDEEADE